MIDILMPRLSDTMEHGTIATWRKKPGDEVAVGDVLVEIETDKAVMEHEAYEAGVLGAILIPEGEQASIGTPIARIDDGASTDGPAVPARATGDRAAGPDEPDPSAVASGLHDALPLVSEDARPAGPQRVLATPLVRKLAQEHGISLDRISGSGPGGRIVRADIAEALAHGGAVAGDRPRMPEPGPGPELPDATRRSTAVPFDRVREVISRRLSDSSATIPQFSVTTVADVEALLVLRAELNGQLEAVSRPRVSVNDLVVRACALALRDHPEVNASYSPEGRGQTILHDRVNIGLAMATDAGLMVPVVLDTDQKPPSRIAQESRRLSALAADRRLGPTDTSGGTFTVSNLGMFGVEQFTALVNPPEGAILAVATATPEPVAREGAVQIRHRMRMTLSADHRIIDGALAARFLRTLAGLLEQPFTLLV